ncbi:MAG TPA: CBS domain-containing protein [Nitrospiria bacterium]|nr:CBS domain-containing protein [Nitrospiria bacterium]
MGQIFVRELMIPNPITIAHDQTVEQATALMGRYKVRRLPVTKAGKLAGIVSDRDVRQLAGRPSIKLPKSESDEAYRNLPVEEIMTPNVLTIREFDTLQSAITSLLENRISGLPVVDQQGALVGMLSETDILKHYLRLLDREEDH